MLWCLEEGWRGTWNSPRGWGWRQRWEGRSWKEKEWRGSTGQGEEDIVWSLVCLGKRGSSTRLQWSGWNRPGNDGTSKTGEKWPNHKGPFLSSYDRWCLCYQYPSSLYPVFYLWLAYGFLDSRQHYPASFANVYGLVTTFWLMGCKWKWRAPSRKCLQRMECAFPSPFPFLLAEMQMW